MKIPRILKFKKTSVDVIIITAVAWPAVLMISDYNLMTSSQWKDYTLLALAWEIGLIGIVGALFGYLTSLVFNSSERTMRCNSWIILLVGTVIAAALFWLTIWAAGSIGIIALLVGSIVSLIVEKVNKHNNWIFFIIGMVLASIFCGAILLTVTLSEQQILSRARTMVWIIPPSFWIVWILRKGLSMLMYDPSFPKKDNDFS